MDPLMPAAQAAALADAACALHDTVAGPQGWSTDTVEDAIEAIEITALALATVRPDSTTALLPIRQGLARLREHLGLPPTADLDDNGQTQATQAAPARRHPARRGLGPGFQGVRIPPGRTAAGR